MLTSIVLLLVGLLAPGLSLPFSSGLQDTAYKKDESVAPEVHLLHSSPNPRDSDDNVKMMCRYTNLNPRDVSITWLENGEPKPLSPNTVRRWKDDKGQTFSITTTLTFNEFLLRVPISCQVTRKPTSTNMKSQVRKKPTGGSNPEPANFTCVMSKEMLAASWSQENPGTLTPKKMEVRTESKGAISQATASITDGKDGETFTCKVEHTQELAGPEGEKTG